MSWRTLNTTLCFPKQIKSFLYLEDKTIYTAEAGLHTHTSVLETKPLSTAGKFGWGHPPSAECRYAGGRGSPSLSVPQSTRPSKDLLLNILKFIHLALRQAEDVLTQAHLRKQQFLGKTAGKMMPACKCSHLRDKMTQEQQKWTQS